MSLMKQAATERHEVRYEYVKRLLQLYSSVIFDPIYRIIMFRSRVAGRVSLALASGLVKC